MEYRDNKYIFNSYPFDINAAAFTLLFFTSSRHLRRPVDHERVSSMSCNMFGSWGLDHSASLQRDKA